MKIEYIASAISHSGGSGLYKRASETPGLQEDMEFIYKSEIPDSKVINFSILYNAYTESKLGEHLVNLDLCNYTMSDSGGLQMVTTASKKSCMKTAKQKVYENQAKYSDVAMCFDEIPLYIDREILHAGGGNSNARLNLNGKYLIEELIEPKALETALNIREQIKTFKKLDSDTKIMVIMQGQDKETYAEYIEHIFNELTEEEHKQIYGIALSSACNGMGELNRIDMYYSLKDLNIPSDIKKNVHLLGVGSLDSLKPILANPEYFSFIENLSFDSSSHTSAFIFGRYVDENFNNVQLTKHLSFKEHKFINELYADYKDIFKKYGSNTVEELINNSTVYSKLNKEKKLLFYNEDIPDTRNGTELFAMLWMLRTIKNFINEMEKCCLDEKYLNKGLKKEIYMSKSIRTHEDYMQWRATAGKTLPSLKIKKFKSIDDINSQSSIAEWF